MSKNNDQTGKKPRRKNDEFLKGAFEEWFPEFLRFIYQNADDLFDFGCGFVFMDKELHAIIPNRERKGGSREADLLVKAYLKDGSEKWILLHTEIEGGSQEDFAFRIFQYHYRLLDRYHVPVETIAVFTGNQNQKRPSGYQYQGIATSIHFRYLNYHIFEDREEDLLSMSNPFAFIVLACQKAHLEGKVPDEELASNRLTIARAMVEQNYDHDRILSFLVFLKNFIYIENQEINRIFDEQIEKLTGGAINMGVLEVLKKQERQETMDKKNHEFVANLIQQTDFDDVKIASLAVVNVSFVQKVRAELSENKK